MKTVTVTDKSLADELLRQGQDEEVIVVRDGHTVAMVVPFDDEDREWYQRERDPVFVASLARAREQVRNGQTTSQEELKKELGL
jgi:antitoxin (DNA-binding transcriptional repressor) of toxin-antitoxin stability system